MRVSGNSTLSAVHCLGKVAPVDGLGEFYAHFEIKAARLKTEKLQMCDCRT